MTKTKTSPADMTKTQNYPEMEILGPKNRAQKRTLLVLVNAFHGTTYSTPLTRDEVDARVMRVNANIASFAEYAWARKVRRALCADDCECSGTIGERA